MAHGRKKTLADTKAELKAQLDVPMTDEPVRYEEEQKEQIGRAHV